MTEDIRTYTADLKEKTSQLRKLRSDNAQLSENCQLYEADNARLREHAQELKAARITIEELRADAASVAERSEEKIAELRAECVRLTEYKNDYGRLRTENLELQFVQKRVEELRGDNSRLREEKAEVQSAQKRIEDAHAAQLHEVQRIADEKLQDVQRMAESLVEVGGERALALSLPMRCRCRLTRASRSSSKRHEPTSRRQSTQAARCSISRRRTSAS